MTGDAPKIVFGTLEASVCELVLNRGNLNIQSSCDINTPSGRRLSISDYDELLEDVSRLKAEVAELRQILQSAVLTNTD